jgi:hypothetical protein
MTEIRNVQKHQFSREISFLAKARVKHTLAADPKPEAVKRHY